MDLLLAAERVRCAVEGHDWDDGINHGFPIVSYTVYMCRRCYWTKQVDRFPEVSRA